MYVCIRWSLASRQFADREVIAKLLLLFRRGCGLIRSFRGSVKKWCYLLSRAPINFPKSSRNNFKELKIVRSNSIHLFTDFHPRFCRLEGGRWSFISNPIYPPRARNSMSYVMPRLRANSTDRGGLRAELRLTLLTYLLLFGPLCPLGFNCRTYLRFNKITWISHARLNQVQLCSCLLAQSNSWRGF